MKIIKYALILPVSLILVFFAISYFSEFNPEKNTPIGEYFGIQDEKNNILPDTFKLMTWNIGYAGLGDNMDCYFDGGEAVRDSRERTELNLADIISKLKKENADIYLLQEVDEKAHRTYSINEIESISKAFPGYYVYYAKNFDVWFVPSPLTEPMGMVCSGVVLLSRIKPVNVSRLQYPSSFSFPVRMFNLKRCLLEAVFKLSDGRSIHIGNTHNTAFDTGEMREVENDFLKDCISEYAMAGDPFIIAGDWNQYPPQYTPSREELENEYFTPELLDTTGVSSFARILCDMEHYSMRYNDKPYDDNSTKSLLDYYIISDYGLQPLELRTLDYHFHSSDHNPVIFMATMK